MARIRSIKPDFFLNEDLAELDPLARLLFIGLWTQADRSGRLEYRPKRLKAALLPYEDCDIDAICHDLSDAGFVTLYEVAGTRYLAVDNFVRHQNPHMKESESLIPAPTCENIQAPDEHDTGTMPAPYEPGGREGRGREGRGRARAREAGIGFGEIWDAYPVHEYRPNAESAYIDVIEDGADPALLLAACHTVPRSHTQSLAFFLTDGTWRDHVPRKRTAPAAPKCPTCLDTGVSAPAGSCVGGPCPDCASAGPDDGRWQE